MVRSDWLTECCIQDQKVNEEDYILIDWNKRYSRSLDRTTNAIDVMIGYN